MKLINVEYSLFGASSTKSFKSDKKALAFIKALHLVHTSHQYFYKTKQIGAALTWNASLRNRRAKLVKDRELYLLANNATHPGKLSVKVTTTYN